jgi:fumarate hydratase subunit beta
MSERRIIVEKHINVPLSKEVASSLVAGDYVYLTGTIYTARDAAHLRLYEAIKNHQEVPINVHNETIYYLGPTPARKDQVIGSAGPTTSSRMDKYTPDLLELGLIGMIGKGKRSVTVIESMKKNGAVYFAAVGGAGALLSKCVLNSEVIAYEDLGTEAIRKLEIKDFPVFVVIDSKGNNLYETAVHDYVNKKQ